MKNLIIILLLVSNSVVFSQNLIVYTQKKKYKSSIVQSTNNFYFFGEYYIDKNKQGIINKRTLINGIEKVITNKNYSDLIVLDIENKVYKDLKVKSKNDHNYEKNINSLIDMIVAVKEIRPKAKIVLYGLPYSFNFDFQKKYNDFEKLKPLIEVVDYLTPALYIHYSSKQKSSKYFDDYIKNNLDLFFKFAEKSNKQVIPFIWYKIHPYNQNYGGDLIDDLTYNNYLNYIKKYRYNGKKVNGVIYWDAQNITIDINNKLTETLKILNQ